MNLGYFFCKKIDPNGIHILDDQFICSMFTQRNAYVDKLLLFVTQTLLYNSTFACNYGFHPSSHFWMGCDFNCASEKKEDLSEIRH